MDKQQRGISSKERRIIRPRRQIDSKAATVSPETHCRNEPSIFLLTVFFLGHRLIIFGIGNMWQAPCLGEPAIQIGQTAMLTTERQRL
jgi:hypothetical protein